MTRAFNPWDPNAVAAESNPVSDLVEQTRAELARPGARVEDVKRRYYEAVARGATQLDPPMTLDAAVAALETPDADVNDYDDGPFAEGPKVSPFMRRPRPRVRRPRAGSVPSQRGVGDTLRRLFGREG
ncbi:MAG: hypothetical protein RMA76_28820 [Deltaproteobacteria bacterium]